MQLGDLGVIAAATATSSKLLRHPIRSVPIYLSVGGTRILLNGLVRIGLAFSGVIATALRRHSMRPARPVSCAAISEASSSYSVISIGNEIQYRPIESLRLLPVERMTHGRNADEGGARNPIGVELHGRRR